MNPISPLTPLSVLLLTMLGSAQDSPHSEVAPTGDVAIHSAARARALADERLAAARALMAAVEDGASIEGLAAAAERAAAMLTSAPVTRGRILAALSTDPDRTTLDRRLEQIADDLGFRPLIQAELALGWPETAPVGEVVLKSYPAYRMARTKMATRGGMNTSFFALFNHIRRNDIAMTAPVRMDRAEDGAGARSADSMAFLYSRPTLGEPGADKSDESVEVIDVAPTMAISIGGRGYETPSGTAVMQESLEAWLAAHREQFEVAGPMRTMGYNSPMVPPSRRFFEIEIPVRRIESRDD